MQLFASRLYRCFRLWLNVKSFWTCKLHLCNIWQQFVVANIFSDTVSGPLNLSKYAFTRGPASLQRLQALCAWPRFCGRSSFTLKIGAFTWPSRLLHYLICIPNQLLREQPLLPMLDVFSADWIRLFQSAERSLLSRMPDDPAFFCWTSRDYRKQDQIYWAASLQEQDTRHHHSGESLH